MKQLCLSDEVVELLGFKYEPDSEIYPEDILKYSKIFPHEYIPETITKTERYINFDLKATLDTTNTVYKDLTIYFFVICHEAVVRYTEKSREYLWYDRAVCALDNLFCEKNVLGIGKTFLVSNVPYCPQQKFKGRLLTFVVKDFNNGLKYGK